MRTNTSMTIYSKSVVNHVEVWTRSVVQNVEWENADIANAMASGVIDADKVTVFVSLSEGELTVKPGDYLVRGIITDEIGPGCEISDIRATYPDVAVIRAVNRLDFGSLSMQHYKIGAS